ncbi:beta-ketoacyl synthase N-terminal-like domain-containing protein [Vibrio taketomensis]|uniref:beta-ketoacyl synthase N-terminal-like domain-containing protein n=1 Tax=Vibrio taketomensis TaxID=2572923 RepID=UPI001389CEA6
MGDVALVIRQLCGVTGPAYTVSTACTSSARALISATKLIRAGVCDAVISGGWIHCAT